MGLLHQSPPYWPPFPGGDYFFDAFKDVIEAAGEAGVLFVDAAGNLGWNNDVHEIYPQNYDCNNIIVVMATDPNDHNWAFSDWGPTSVDLGAPGLYIWSCKPGNEYRSDGGTSMAQPHVAGACALLWSANPYLSHLQVKQIIMDTVDDLEELEGLCVAGGRLNVYKAMDSLYNFTVV